jgi:hypothetical protein
MPLDIRRAPPESSAKPRDVAQIVPRSTSYRNGPGRGPNLPEISGPFALVMPPSGVYSWRHGTGPDAPNLDLRAETYG